jgi:diguanylate cyclase (GGDEF)-like protein
MAEQNSILIVDDTEANIDILLGLLGNYDVLVALDGETALDIAREEKVDLILLDILMPGLDGYETCRRLKSDAQTADIPVVFITAKTDEDSIEQAYEVGGLDYVTKPFKPRELLARVKTQLKVKGLIEHLDRLSSYDSMTSVYNRRKFFELGESLFDRVKESGGQLYGMMVDIDKFKAINDNYGHPVGDQVIIAMAQGLQAGISSTAIMGRLGGEEFAVLDVFENDDEAVSSIEFLRQSMEDLSVPIDTGEILKFTISGGLARIKSEHQSLDDLLREADDNLYQAKGAGRNKAIFRG